MKVKVSELRVKDQRVEDDVGVLGKKKKSMLNGSSGSIM